MADFLKISYNFADGNRLRDRLGNADYNLLKDAKYEGGLEALLSLVKVVADLRKQIAAMELRIKHLEAN